MNYITHSIILSLALITLVSTNTAHAQLNTIAPAPITIDLESTSDTGISQTDNYTSDTTPTFTGHSVPGSVVTLFASTTGQLVGEKPLCKAIVPDSGTWSCTTPELASHPLSLAYYFRAEGPKGLTTTPLKVFIDNENRQATTKPAIVGADDDGISNSDGITSLKTIRVWGFAENNVLVNIYVDGIYKKTVTSNSSGRWFGSITLKNTGVYKVDTIEIDRAGNRSPNSVALEVTIVEPDNN